MQQMSRIPRGQPISAGLTADKWHLHQAVSDGAAELGITYRQVEVLRALLTFHPSRDLGEGQPVVFPSNATLAARLGGMPESTLRRHLARLVTVGLVARHDSPNRKRYAHRCGMVFGFDLSPLIQRRAEIEAAARHVKERAARIADLKDRIRFALGRIVSRQGWSEPLHNIARALRRKLDEGMLMDLLGTLETPANTEEVSAPDSENERHIYSTDHSVDVEEGATLIDAVQTCRGYRAFLDPGSPPPAQISRLGSVLGIHPNSLRRATDRIGWQKTLAALVLMIERGRDIHHPGAYLGGICRKAENGALNLQASLGGVRARRAASAIAS